MNIGWRDFYFQLAELVSRKSHCRRAKVGAVIVNGDSIVFGYNGTPSGHDNCCEDSDGETLPEVLHAEMNAIAKLAKNGGNKGDTKMFITRPPCMECAKLILSAGINTVFFITDDGAGEGLELLSHHALVKAFKRSEINWR